MITKPRIDITTWRPQQLTASALLALIISVAIVISGQIAVHAAPVVGFNPGKIIDDVVFTRSNSMSASQIQGFLNSKVPSCDTWGTKTSEYGGGTRAQWGAARGTPAPFTCLRDYSESGKSSAQIIYDAAQEFRINPQVLIVLLQKEQGLVTDEWPLPVQYKTATGYGCPDTAPCDTQYYGLTNQIRWSARMFRAIMDASPTWYTPYVLGSNFIRWNPSASCGGSTVIIENRATQALYNYTPYRPNQAALNAGYGIGDSCSAYGNRNFYQYFSDWFGTVRSNDTLNPHPDGTLVNIDNVIFLVYAGGLHHIANPSVFESHSYQWNEVKPATTGDKSIPFSWPVDYLKPGVLYSDTNAVYTTVRENDQWVKKPISYQSFLSLNYRWDMIRKFPAGELPSVTSSTILTSNTHPDGTLIKNSSGVFYIDGGTKRYVSPQVFESHRWKWSDIVDESEGDKLLPPGANMLLRMGSVLFDRNGLYIVEIPQSGAEIKRPIGPWECFDAVMRYRLSETVIVPTSLLPAQSGAIVTC